MYKHTLPISIVSDLPRKWVYLCKSMHYMQHIYTYICTSELISISPNNTHYTHFHTEKDLLRGIIGCGRNICRISFSMCFFFCVCVSCFCPKTKKGYAFKSSVYTHSHLYMRQRYKSKRKTTRFKSFSLVMSVYTALRSNVIKRSFFSIVFFFSWTQWM